MNTPKTNLTEQMIDSLELPRDVLLGIPYISMCGNREFNIDNHRGIQSYVPGEIIIRTKQGAVRLSGKNLLIEYYNSDSIKLTGQITEICFVQ